MLGSATSLQEISLFDLGDDTTSMLTTWRQLKKQEQYIMIKEFPYIDCYQTIDDKDIDIVELALEICQCIENKKKEVAKQKQADGIKKARNSGIQLGRKPLEVPKNFHRVYRDIKSKKINLTQATRILKVDYRTLKKWIKEVHPEEM